MSNKIYIGNLPYQSSEGDIESLLAGYGAIVSVRIIKDRETGRSKGFGFAEFESADAMNKAIDDLNGQDYQGRNLRVNVAEDKPRSSGGPRPRGRY